ncbi:MAG: VanZ family protein [Burkholderiaceae bacterium]
MALPHDSTDRPPAAPLSATDAAVCRAWLRGAALAYLVFAVAGSLVPFNWQPLALEAAWPLVWQRLGDVSGAVSRVDVGVNVLLFIPLAYLVCGGLLAGRRWAAPVAIALLPLWPWLAGLIEFAQLAFPPRVTSVSDVLAESLGGAIGTALWLATGRAFCAGALAWARARHRSGRWPILLYAYAIALLAYSLLPLDLSLSPADLYGKWKAGRIVLVPFGFHYTSTSLAWIDRALDTAMWVPVGLLATLAQRGSWRRTLLLCGLTALLLQVLKLPVLSRVSDVTDILFAVAGGALGVGLARLAGWADTAPSAAPVVDKASCVSRSQALMLVALLVYSLLLPAMFWFPYEFRTDPDFLAARAAAWAGVPLASLFGAEELSAAGSIVRKLLAFVPLGALLTLLAASLPWRWRRVGMALAAGWAVGVVVLVQAGQLLVPDRFPDATGAALMLLGAVSGAVAIAGWPRRHAAAIGTVVRQRQRRGWPQWGRGWLLITAVIWLVTHAPGVPYNLPGVLRPDFPIVSAALIAAALALGAAWPGLARRVASGEAPPALLWRWPLLLVAVAGAVAAALMLGAVPIKITKLVGTTSLGWPAHTETWARLTVLVGTMLWMLLGGSVLAWTRLVPGPTRSALLAVWLAGSCLILPLAYWVIVIEAVTDNLVELIAHEASPLAAAGVAAWFALMGATAASIARLLRRGVWRAGLALGVALASVGLGWGLLQWVTEPALFKYGAQFSALQFLLSADRQHYLPLWPLLARYAMVHATVLAYGVWAMGPVVWPPPSPRPAPKGRAQASPVMRPASRSML